MERKNTDGDRSYESLEELVDLFEETDNRIPGMYLNRKEMLQGFGVLFVMACVAVGICWSVWWLLSC